MKRVPGPVHASAVTPSRKSPRSPVDNGAAHNTRLWTAATRSRRCPPASHELCFRPDALLAQLALMKFSSTLLTPPIYCPALQRIDSPSPCRFRARFRLTPELEKTATLRLPTRHVSRARPQAR